jgi:hypothetical protein
MPSFRNIDAVEMPKLLQKKFAECLVEHSVLWANVIAAKIIKMSNGPIYLFGKFVNQERMAFTGVSDNDLKRFTHRIRGRAEKGGEGNSLASSIQ